MKSSSPYRPSRSPPRRTYSRGDDDAADFKRGGSAGGGGSKYGGSDDERGGGRGGGGAKGGGYNDDVGAKSSLRSSFDSGAKGGGGNKWECGECQYKNYEEDDTCQRCATLRKGGGAAGAPASRDLGAKSSGLGAPTRGGSPPVGVRRAAAMDDFAAADDKLKSLGGGAGTWKCLKCTRSNPNDEAYCLHCATRKPAAGAASAGLGAGSASANIGATPTATRPLSGRPGMARGGLGSSMDRPSSARAGAVIEVEVNSGSASTAGAAKKPPVREVWTCTACKRLNMKKADNCNYCKADRNGGGGPAPSAAGASTPAVRPRAPLGKPASAAATPGPSGTKPRTMSR